MGTIVDKGYGRHGRCTLHYDHRRTGYSARRADHQTGTLDAVDSRSQARGGISPHLANRDRRLQAGPWCHLPDDVVQQQRCPG